MGLHVHTAVIVTSWNHKAISDAIKAAESLDLEVVGPSSGNINSYQTFMIPPSGLSLTSPTSEESSTKLQAFRAYLESAKYDDGSSCLEHVFITYGNDLKSLGKEKSCD